MLEKVLDFDHAVEGDIGKLLVHRSDDAKRMSGAVQEIGVSKRDVSCASVNLVANILKDDFPRHDEKSAFIDGWDRAMETEVLAAATRLHITSETIDAIVFKTGILFKRRERSTAWDDKGETFQEWGYGLITLDNSLSINGFFACEGVDKFDKGHLIFAAEHRVGMIFEQVIGVQRGIKPVEADVTIGIDFPDTLCHADSQAQGSVHRDANSNEPSASHFFDI
jgi:hypothetical protein